MESVQGVDYIIIGRIVGGTIGIELMLNGKSFSFGIFFGFLGFKLVFNIPKFLNVFFA